MCQVIKSDDRVFCIQTVTLTCYYMCNMVAQVCRFKCSCEPYGYRVPARWPAVSQAVPVKTLILNLLCYRLTSVKILPLLRQPPALVA